MDNKIEVTVEKLPESQVKLTISVPPEEFTKTLDKAYDRLHKSVDVKGFRAGKAPKNLILEALGTRLYDEGLNLLIKDYTTKVLDQEKIYPITHPEYGLETFDPEKPIVYTAQFAVMPEVHLEGLEKVQLDKEEVQKAKDARTHIEEEANKAKKRAEEGVPEPEEKDKESLEEKEETPGFNLDEYYSKMFDQIIKNITLDIPHALVHSELHRYEENYVAKVQSLGINIDDFLKLQQTSLADLREKWEADIAFSLKQDLILQAYAKQKNIEITDEDLDKQLRDMYKEEEIEKLDQYSKDYVKSAMKKQKAFLALIDEIEKQ